LLTFSTSVDACAYVATVASITPQNSYLGTRMGLAEPVPVTGAPTQVRVFTSDDKVNAANDRSFHIAVLC